MEGGRGGDGEGEGREGKGRGEGERVEYQNEGEYINSPLVSSSGPSPHCLGPCQRKTGQTGQSGMPAVDTHVRSSCRLRSSPAVVTSSQLIPPDPAK